MGDILYCARKSCGHAHRPHMEYDVDEGGNPTDRMIESDSACARCNCDSFMDPKAKKATATA